MPVKATDVSAFTGVISMPLTPVSYTRLRATRIAGLLSMKNVKDG